MATVLNTLREREAAPESLPPYQRIPAYLIRRLQLISTAVLADALEGEDMGVLEWAIFAVIAHHPDIDQSALSELASIDRTNTGRFADLLESKGLIERRPSDSDRRAWLVSRSPESRKIGAPALAAAVRGPASPPAGSPKPEQ